jgi:aryl-alcohol dehydrogenase-like predicted oxidoreductase
VPADSRAADEAAGKFIREKLNDDVLTRVQLLKPIADDLGLTMAQLALAWVLQNKNVSSAIVGASRPDQIASNIAAAGVKLSADVMAKIDEITLPIAETDPALTTAPETRLV